MYIHTHIPTYICICVHTYIYNTHVNTYIHTYICICVHTYIYNTHIHPYTHTFTYTYIHMYMYTYIQTYIHTYIHTQHIYTHTHISLRLLRVLELHCCFGDEMPQRNQSYIHEDIKTSFNLGNVC
jgi:hypothetical protein